VIAAHSTVATIHQTETILLSVYQSAEELPKGLRRLPGGARFYVAFMSLVLTP
jgi:uncharacterized membrane protein